MWLYLSDSFIYGLLSTLQCLISFPSREKNMFLQMSGFLISWRMKCFFIRKLSSFSWSNKPIKKPKTGCFSDSKSSWLVLFFVFFLSFCCFLLFFLKICSPHRTATLQIYDDLRNMMHCCKWHEPMIYKVVKTSNLSANWDRQRSQCRRLKFCHIPCQNPFLPTSASNMTFIKYRDPETGWQSSKYRVKGRATDREETLQQFSSAVFLLLSHFLC